MTARRLAILLLWAILASILWFNIVLVQKLAELDDESIKSRGLFSLRKTSSRSEESESVDIDMNGGNSKGSVSEESGDDDYSYDDDESGDDGSSTNDEHDDDDGTNDDDDDEEQEQEEGEDYRRTRHHFDHHPLHKENHGHHPFWMRGRGELLMRETSNNVPLPQRRRASHLPIDFTSPVTKNATQCVSKSRDTGKCTLTPCHHESSTIDSTTPLSYSNGAILRDNAIRGTTMTLAGKAKSGSGCAISHAHKFIYIHVLKSGGMTIKAFLKRALCDGSTQMPCSNGGDVLRIANCARAIQQHPDYFVFSFVRNPYSRLYSGYSMATMYEQESKGRNAQSENPRRANAPSFREFALRPRIRERMSQVSTTHYVPQSYFLFDQNDCPVFDFVGRLESFEEDMARVLSFIGSTELVHAFHNGVLKHEESTAYGSRNLQHSGGLEEVYMDDEVRRTVANEFERDFDLLGYDSDIVPS